jgi:hypothetical protein
VSPKEEPPIAIPIGQMTVLEDLIRAIDDLIRSAKSVPLSSSAMIHRKEALGLIETLMRSLPEEIARARAVIRDRDEALERAAREGERLVGRAKAEREKMLARTEIVQAAAREADRLIADAEAQAKRIRHEAEEYAEGKLANFEVVLQKTLAAVERGRARLAGRMEADQLASEELEPPDR